MIRARTGHRIGTGRARMYDHLMERALNGVTTIRLRLDGDVEIARGPDGALIAAHLRGPPPAPRRALPGSATATRQR